MRPVTPRYRNLLAFQTCRPPPGPEGGGGGGGGGGAGSSGRGAGESTGGGGGGWRTMATSEPAQHWQSIDRPWCIWFQVTYVLLPFMEAIDQTFSNQLIFWIKGSGKG